MGGCSSSLPRVRSFDLSSSYNSFSTSTDGSSSTNSLSSSTEIYLTKEERKKLIKRFTALVADDDRDWTIETERPSQSLMSDYPSKDGCASSLNCFPQGCLPC